MVIVVCDCQWIILGRPLLTADLVIAEINAETLPRIAYNMSPSVEFSAPRVDVDY